MFDKAKLMHKINQQKEQITTQQGQIDQLLETVDDLKQLLNADYDLNHFKNYAERKKTLNQQSQNNLLYRLTHHILGYYYQHDRYIHYLDLQNLFAISIGILRKVQIDKTFINDLKVAYANNPCISQRYGVYNKTLIAENYKIYAGSLILPDEDIDIPQKEFMVLNPYLDNFYDDYIVNDKTIELCGIVQQKLFDNGLQMGDKIPFKQLTLITQTIT